ncbi:tetraacyldisaccharide 4'-kinase [Marinimicrobium alkaliphilum]|uniref:tetraacyldisaccharide 4'-kinase n=1 Tax=Marinimicrobium alkaliphilum TaxID=2202654 RepID=UPI000DB9FED5|nr:tetraacyldisaccharide 4'-kinase [Marinimicrobium alkaliphilum]
MASNKDSAWLSAWYGKRRWTLLLLPLTGLFCVLSGLRGHWLKRRQQRLAVPVVVVGNISVGGTGKTPLLIALTRHLQAQGYRPGIISRGYGARPPAYPFLVEPESPVAEAGDEPLAIARETGAPVAIDPDRVAAGRALIAQGCTLLLSDDGLQHYRLARQLEIAVVDGQRLLGNGWRLPVGPLREPAERLNQVDLVVLNSPQAGALAALSLRCPQARIQPMQIVPGQWRRVSDDTPLALEEWRPANAVDAIAGIGNPARFFDTLTQLGLPIKAHAFADHQTYSAENLAFVRGRALVMTAKDAVKCRALARQWGEQEWYYLAVSAEPHACFWEAFDAKIAALNPRRA